MSQRNCLANAKGALVLAFALVIAGSFCLSGCVTPRCAPGEPYATKCEALKAYEAARDFHNAFLALQAAEGELAQWPSEGSVTAFEFELVHLCSTTAWSGNGEQWTRIFKDPRIGIEYKAHLVEWIHEGALKDAWE